MRYCRISGGIALLFVAFKSFEVGAAPAEEGAPAEPLGMQDRAAAEALFQDAKRLGEAGRLAEACVRFEESQRADPALGTLLHLAICYTETGKTASAWAALHTVAELAHRANDSAREALARRRASELERKLSRLVLSIARPAPGVVVRLDSRTFGVAALETPLPVDPGLHTLEVTAPGKRKWTRWIEIAPGPVDETVEIVLIEDAKMGSRSTPPLHPLSLRAKSAGLGVERNPWHTQRLAAMGIGAVGLALGSYFGVRAIAQTEDADRYCSGRTCAPTGLEAHARARTSARLADIGFVVGLAGVAGAVYFTFATGSARSRQRAALGLRRGRKPIGLGGTF